MFLLYGGLHLLVATIIDQKNQSQSVCFSTAPVYSSVAVCRRSEEAPKCLRTLTNHVHFKFCLFIAGGRDRITTEVSGSKKKKKKRKKRCQAAAATQLESSEVTGESLALSGRTGWTDSETPPEFCVSAVKRCDDRRSEKRLCSTWQFCLRCNSQSQKLVESDISLQRAFFHFAKCTHRSSR